MLVIFEFVSVGVESFSVDVVSVGVYSADVESVSVGIESLSVEALLKNVVEFWIFLIYNNFYI